MALIRSLIGLKGDWLYLIPSEWVLHFNVFISFLCLFIKGNSFAEEKLVRFLRQIFNNVKFQLWSDFLLIISSDIANSL